MRIALVTIIGLLLLAAFVVVVQAQEPFDNKIFVPFAATRPSEILSVHPDRTVSARNVDLIDGILEWGYQDWDNYVILFQMDGSEEWCHVNSVFKDKDGNFALTSLLHLRSFFLSSNVFALYYNPYAPCIRDIPREDRSRVFNFALADNAYSKHTHMSNVVTYDFSYIPPGTALLPSYTIDTYPVEESGSVVIRWRNIDIPVVHINDVQMSGFYISERSALYYGTVGNEIEIKLFSDFYASPPPVHTVTVTVE